MRRSSQGLSESSWAAERNFRSKRRFSGTRNLRLSGFMGAFMVGSFRMGSKSGLNRVLTNQPVGDRLNKTEKIQAADVADYYWLVEKSGELRTTVTRRNRRQFPLAGPTPRLPLPKERTSTRRPFSPFTPSFCCPLPTP